MMLRSRLLILFFLSVVATGLQGDRSGGIYTLKNAWASVEIVPRIGRIMSYRLNGGDNVLWVNDFKTPGVVNRLGDWTNYGGDKVWCAPQSEWTAYQGADWPPDTSLDGAGWEVLRATSRRLVMRSPVSRIYRVQVTRTIELSARSSALRIRNHYRRFSAHPGKIAVWTITQLPLAELTLVGRNDGETRLSPVNLNPDWPMRPAAFAPLASGRILAYAHPLRQRANVGFGCHWLAVVRHRVMLRQEWSDAVGAAGPVTGIVYTAPREKYMELEFFRPVGVLPPSGEAGLTVTWRLLPCPSDGPTEAAALAVSVRQQDDDFDSDDGSLTPVSY